MTSESTIRGAGAVSVDQAGRWFGSNPAGAVCKTIVDFNDVAMDKRRAVYLIAPTGNGQHFFRSDEIIQPIGDFWTVTALHGSYLSNMSSGVIAELFDPILGEGKVVSLTSGDLYRLVADHTAGPAQDVVRVTVAWSRSQHEEGHRIAVRSLHNYLPFEPRGTCNCSLDE